MLADEILEHDPVFLDTETTGLYRSSEVVEVAVVDRNGRKLYESPREPRRRHPRRRHRGPRHHKPDGRPSARLGLRLAPPARSPVRPHSRHLQRPFDTRILRQSTEQKKMTWAPIGAQVCCVMQMYRKFYPSLGKGKAKKYSLETACRQFGIHAEQTHGALDDAKLTAQVFGFLARNGKPAPTPAPDPPIVDPPIAKPAPTPPSGAKPVPSITAKIGPRRPAPAARAARPHLCRQHLPRHPDRRPARPLVARR